MAYFTKDLIKFLKELKKNNDRDWFNANKKRYLSSVKEPFEVFIGDLIEAMSPHFESLAITPKEAIFRIYRDVRFSKNKSPYKVQVSALVNPGGRKAMTMPGIYLEITPDHFRVYSGMYMLDSKQLKNLRFHITHNLEEFTALISDKKFLKVFGEIRGEKNKIIQKEFKEDGEIQPLLYNKQFYYFTEWPPEVILEDKLIEQVVAAFLVAQPLSEFLYEGIH
jgi:uncharacterized protein (TIGR02453 family)